MNNKLFQPKIVFIFLFVLLFNSVIVLSEYNYYSDEQFYESTVGYFNELNPFEMDRVSMKPTFSPTITPLINDLDNSGLNEILILDDNILRIFKTKNLDIITDKVMPETINNIKIYNFDGTNYIMSIGANSIYFYIFNGTEILHYSNHTNFLTGTHNLKIDVGCDEITKNCIGVGYYGYYGGSAIKTIYVNSLSRGFNLSHKGIYEHVAQDTSYTTGGSSNPSIYVCHNNKNFMTVSDIDNTGKKSYISSALADMHIPGTSALHDRYLINTFQIETIDLNVSKSKDTLIYQFDRDKLDSVCTTYSGSIISTPLLLEFDGINSNGLEIVFGVMESTTTFRLKSYKQIGNTWSYIRQYPSAFTSDGIMLSNPIKADAFADTGVNDVCVLGFKTADSLLTLLCASEQTSTFYRSYEWDYKVNYNLSFVNPHIFSVYSGQHTSEQLKDNRFTFGHQYFNPTEFVTPYGVFKLTMNKDLFFDWIYDMELIWENPFQNTMLFATDYLNKNRVDLIGLSDTNLYYIDDGFTTSGAVISQQYFNPCLDVTWRVNTTLEVRFRVSDIDNDLVSARAVLYEDTLFEQDSGWSNNLSSGTTFNFNFDVNTTISNGILSIYGRDTSNPLEIDSYSYPISVAGHYGAVFGECYTYIEGSEFGDIEFIEDTVAIDKKLDKSDNIIRNVIVDINDAYDLGLGTTLIWLILTLCVVGGIFLSITGAKNHLPMGASMGVIILCFSLMMVIGTYLGFIGAGLLVVMVIVALIVLSVVYGKMFFGQSGGN